MSDVVENGTESPTEMEIPDHAPTFRDRVKQQREEVAADKWHDIDVPGYNGDLFVRYRLLSGDDIDEINQRVRQTVKGRSEQLLAVTLDNLIAACDEVWVRDEGRELPLREHETYTGPHDLPVKFDAALADYLEFTNELPDPPTARSVLLALFGGNDLAISAHGARLIQWMMKAGRDMDMLLGEG
jgi:hypothetical protein